MKFSKYLWVATQLSPSRAMKVAVLALLIGTCNAQQSPWGQAAEKLANEFTGPIARGFALVAVVVGGLTVAFSENSVHRTVGAIVIGLGMALGAAAFITWLF